MDIKDFLVDNNYPTKHKIRFYPEIQEQIYERTKFLDDLKNKNKLDFLIRLQCIIDDVYELPKCANCLTNDVSSVIRDNSIVPYKVAFTLYCSRVCIGKGSSQKRQDTVMSKYKVNNVGQQPVVKDKIAKTMLSRYGQSSYQKTQEFKAKYRKTVYERYGKSHFSHTNQFKEKIKLRDDTKHFSSELKQLLKDDLKMHQQYLEAGSITNLQGIHGCQQSYLSKHFIKNKIEFSRTGKGLTYPEMIISQLLEDIGVEFVTGDRSLIKPYELDFYIPQRNLAIEVNGNYWHSVKHKTKNYHQNKSIMAMNNCIELIHVWEDKLFTNREELFRYITSKLTNDTNSKPSKMIISNTKNNSCFEFINKHRVFDSDGNVLYQHDGANILQVVIYKLIHGDIIIYDFLNPDGLQVFDKFVDYIRYLYGDIDLKILDNLDLPYVSDVSSNNKLIFDSLIPPSYFYSRGRDRYTGFTTDECQHKILSDNGYLKSYNQGGMLFKIERREK